MNNFTLHLIQERRIARELEKQRLELSVHFCTINFEKSFQTQFDPRVSSQKYGESFTTNNSRVVKSDHVTHPRKMYPVIKIGVVPEFIQEEPSKNEIVRTRDRSWKLSPAS